jgi:hypothetical protein
MDVHESLPEGATAKDVAQAHAADVRTQDQYGVNYLKYWVDEQGGKVSAWSRRRTPRPRCACTARPMGWSPTVSTGWRKAPSRRQLVLQPHLLFASLVVCASRSSLMAASPS